MSLDSLSTKFAHPKKRLKPMLLSLDNKAADFACLWMGRHVPVSVGSARHGQTLRGHLPPSEHPCDAFRVIDLWNEASLHSNGRILSPFVGAFGSYPGFVSVIENKVLHSSGRTPTPTTKSQPSERERGSPSRHRRRIERVRHRRRPRIESRVHRVRHDAGPAHTAGVQPRRGRCARRESRQENARNVRSCRYASIRRRQRRRRR